MKEEQSPPLTHTQKIEESHRCHVEQEKPGTKEFTLYDSAYINFNRGQNQSIVIKSK